MAQCLKTSLSVREVLGSNAGPDKSDTLAKARHRYDVSMLPRRKVATMGPATRNALRRNIASIKKI